MSDVAPLTRARWALIDPLVVVMIIAYGVPFIGLPVSLCLPVLALVLRTQLWKGVSGQRSVLCGVLGLDRTLVAGGRLFPHWLVAGSVV